MDNAELKNKLNNEYNKLEQDVFNLINTITDNNQEVIQQVVKKLIAKKILIQKQLKELEKYNILINKLVNEYNI